MISRLICLGLLLTQGCSSSLLDWLGWGSTTQLYKGAPLLDIPFEELGPEDKFLVEANKITGLKIPQLDVCQHKLVMKIKASCGSLSDEDLAKLAVNLLNCQADLEGRETYPCTADMSLKSCTSNMNAETWNAYHTMSNRARAVCYAARQQEFRAMAEITVNKLVATAAAHIDHMAALNDKQKKLEVATEIALDRIVRSQHDVLSSYSRLRRLESGIGSKIEEDKAGLQAIGNIVDNEAQIISKSLKDFKQAIDEASQEFTRKTKTQTLEQEKVKNYISETLKMVQDLSGKLGILSSALDKYSGKSSVELETSFKRLEGISNSLNDISTRMTSLQKVAVDKMTLLTSLLGENGEKIDLIGNLVVHLVCLAVSMVMCSFLNLSHRVRVLLLIGAILDIYLSQTAHAYAVDLIYFYSTFAGAVLIDLMVMQIYNYIQNKKLTTAKSPNRSSSPEMNFQNRIESNKIEGLNGVRKPTSKVNDWLTEKYADRKNGYPLNTPILSRKDRDDISVASGMSTRSKTRGRNISPTPSRCSALGSLSSASGLKNTCQGTRVDGQPCKMLTKPGTYFCRVHNNKL